MLPRGLTDVSESHLVACVLAYFSVRPLEFSAVLWMTDFHKVFCRLSNRVLRKGIVFAFGLHLITEIL